MALSRLNLFAIKDHNGQSFGPREQTVHDIRTITLDLDDTLWAIAPVIARAEQCLYEWFGERFPGIVEQFSMLDILALRNRVFEENRDRIHDMTILRRAVIERVGKECGYNNIPIDEAFAVFDKVRNEPELFPDVRPVLKSLKKRYTLVAVTDGNANLDKIGISDLFDEFVSAQTAGAAKPDRRIFDAAVSVGGAPQAQTLHVGDHPQKDVQGARDAGLKTVWINRDEARWPDALAAPDSVVTDLYELNRILMPLR
jgi:putative hydrolase of the HAD superfamily